nr:unnamed protein product [Haemonchus contortus]
MKNAYCSPNGEAGLVDFNSHQAHHEDAHIMASVRHHHHMYIVYEWNQRKEIHYDGDNNSIHDGESLD